MLTVFSRILHYGFKNFWRNGWPSAATVAIMTLSLLVFLGLIMFNFVTDAAVVSIQEKIDISIYFKTNTAEDEILKIRESLQGLPQVKGVEYISSDRALEIFKERHKEDAIIVQTINELSANPLQASLNIKAHSPEDYPAIAEYLNAPNLKATIDKATYFENQVVIDHLIKIVTNVNRGGLLLTIVLAFVAGLVVFTTILLAIYSARDEISIMRAVGASNMLVRGPFVVEGVIAGLLAAVLSLIVAAPLLYIASPYFTFLIPGLDVFRHFYTNLFMLLVYQIGFGVLVGGFSSFVAVRRYLKN